ncbi:type II restriction endonuclease [Mycoplasma sp. ES3225-GEN-MYC]|uniref:Uncharacterized protein n=1 Tax=Mycoplasma miroungigenitalium TaxID=754515 RepID=A0A6M4J8L4_9MOLU|nr:DpnII family type II restriction endonuclease [Mycoplasma miroungigenitalium]MBU4691489.1 type II restriction endonuclease [Mycoplasma miroungigenitalium]QJR43324.1 hypothetical protein HLA87_00675 [Mycoplasma miroungigenitalium]
MKLKFEDWLKTFKSILFSYDYFVDFAKVRSNVNKINNELSKINSLIGSKNIKEDFRKIILNNAKLVEIYQYY